MLNFRDFGGCKSSDGRFVKKGLFFRSGNLSNLSKEDIQILKDLKIKVVFDYRDDAENLASPSQVVKNIKYIRVPAILTPNPNEVKFGSVEDMISKMFDNNGAFDMLKETYYNLPVNNKSYKKLVELIQDESNLPILTHCTAGKDRTGVGCAIILMILGVTKEEIIKDYLKSNQSSSEAISEIMTARPELQSIPKEKLKYIFGVNEEYINEVFRRINDDYETIENYLYKEFNLTRNDLKNLRDKYLC